MARLVAHQARYEILAFLRDPAALFFTALLPVIFLLIFATIFGNETIDTLGVKGTTYYVPGIVSLAVIAATFMNFAINVTEQRDMGLLKRLRGTPLPPAIYIAGRVALAISLSLFMAILIVVLGYVIYGVEVPTTTAPAFLITVIIGAACFCCLGAAMTTVIPSANSAPAIANAIALPLYFISGIFIPSNQIPGWLNQVADVFPVKPFGQALFSAFDPAVTGSAFSWDKLAVVGAWGLFGVIVALRRFRWEPNHN